MDVNELRAKDLMREEVETICETATLLAAAKRMRDCNVSSLVVERINEMDAFGIITRKDIVEELVEEAMSSGGKTVGDIMTKPAFTVSPHLAVRHCLQMMKMVGIRRVPVVEGEELVGILSNSDLFQRLIEDLS